MQALVEDMTTTLFGFEGASEAEEPGREEEIRPVGQAAKTAASHAANVGSIPARVTSLRL